MAEEKKEILSEEILEGVNGGLGGGNNDVETTVVLTCPLCGNNGKHIRYSGARVRCMNCGAVYVA